MVEHAWSTQKSQAPETLVAFGDALEDLKAFVMSSKIQYVFFGVLAMWLIAGLLLQPPKKKEARML